MQTGFPTLFEQGTTTERPDQPGKTCEKLRRLDLHSSMRKSILPFCRLKYGDIWEDPVRGHKVGVLDASKKDDVFRIVEAASAQAIINDPPYNIAVGNANTENLFRVSLAEI